jgi:putative transposase
MGTPSKKELLYRRPWPTVRETRAAIAEYIEVFYNRQRKHSILGYVSPAVFEVQMEREAAFAA